MLTREYPFAEDAQLPVTLTHVENTGSLALATHSVPEDPAPVEPGDTRHSDVVGMAVMAMDIRRGTRRVALISIKNGHAPGGAVEFLDTNRNYGIRYLGLLRNGHNDTGGSAVSIGRREELAAEHGGLSNFGHAMVRRGTPLGSSLTSLMCRYPPTSMQSWRPLLE